MELVKILREVWSQKRLVAIVLIVAALTGLLLAYHPAFPPQSRQYRVSIASSNILVDTSNSQVVDVGEHGPDLPILAGRANLLGNLMTAGPLKNAIAKRGGISPDDLVVVPPANAETPGVAPVPVKTSQSGKVPDAEAIILTLSTDSTLPILHVVAQAPDPDTARKLSGGTIVELQNYLGSVAASQKIPRAHQLVMRQFGTPVVGTATRGLPRSLALAAAMIVALLGCAAIVGGSWFIRSWRQIEEAERVASAGGTPTTEPETALPLSSTPDDARPMALALALESRPPAQPNRAASAD